MTLSAQTLEAIKALQHNCLTIVNIQSKTINAVMELTTTKNLVRRKYEDLDQLIQYLTEEIEIYLTITEVNKVLETRQVTLLTALDTP
jgi:hypothetical protein